MLIAIYALIFFSGLTGLIYQVTWQKYLSIMLGSHAQASALVLALFFLFLSFGYELFGRISPRLSKDRLMQYAGLEFLIGLFALYSPTYFELLFESYMTTSGGLTVSLLYSALFIGFPTILMGGTIPVLTQGLSSSFEASAKTHSLIYSFNTLGAFLGVVVGGFYLIEKSGLPGTLTLTGDVNLLIGMAAFLLAKRNNFNFVGPEAYPRERAKGASFTVLLLFTSFLSGFYVFTAEKLVIRLSSLSAGSSVYSYSIVVAAFVFAIGLGSLVLSRYEKHIHPKSFVAILLATFMSLTLTYLSVEHWPDLILRTRFLFQNAEMNFIPFWLTVLVLLTGLLLVPVGLMGTNLPILFGILKQQGTDLSSSVGRLYAINCFGAACGAIIGGYLAFSYFEGHQVFKIVLILVAVAGFLGMKVIGKSWLVAGIYLLLCCALTFILPEWSPNHFTPGKHLLSKAPVQGDFGDFFRFTKDKKILFERFDPNTYVSVTEEPDGARGLYVNGKPDAVTNADHFTRAMAALTPISLAAKPVEKVFIVGLGGGLSTAVASYFPDVQKVRVAEISSGVVDALPFFEKFNFKLSERMNKVEVVVGDGYKVYLSDPETYDLVICEPSNPWIAGIEKLYSKEFYEAISSKLPPHGLFAQWFPMSTDKETVLSIFKTFATSFPHVTVWSAGGGALTLLGSKQKFQPNFANLQKRFADHKEFYQKLEIASPDMLMAGQLLSDFEVRSLLDPDGDVNSVYDPLLEFRAGRSFFSGNIADLDSIRMQKLPLPIPASLEKDSVGYVGNSMAPEVFTQAKKTISMHFLARLRLILNLWRTNPNESVLKDEYKLLNDYLFLLGQKEKSEVSGGVLETVSALAMKLRQLNAIMEFPKLGNIDRIISNSQNETEQAKAKVAVLGSLGAPEALQALYEGLKSPKEPTPEDRLKIAEAYNALLQTYKEIGAY